MKNLTEKNENVAVLENVEKKVVRAEKVYLTGKGSLPEVKENEKSIFNIHAMQIIAGIENLKEENDKFTLLELEQRVLFLFPNFFDRPNGSGKSTQSFKSIFSVWAGKIKKAGYII